MTLIVKQLSASRRQKKIFVDISFVAHPGEIILITGENGAGKSTLLRLLAGITTPSAGDIHWQAVSLLKQRDAYQEEVHFIGHSNGIKLGLSVAENLALQSLLLQKKITYDTLLMDLNLYKERDQLAHTLSAGQKRRLALAKLFLFPKRIWILDEPLTALDQATKLFFTTQLEQHIKNNGICIMSTHEPLTFSFAAPQQLRVLAC